MQPLSCPESWYTVSPMIWRFLDRNGFSKEINSSIFPSRWHRMTAGRHFLRSVQELTQADHTEAEAIEILIDTNYGWYRYKLRTILHQIYRGLDLGDAIIQADPEFPSRAFLPGCTEHEGSWRRLSKDTPVSRHHQSFRNLIPNTHLTDENRSVTETTGP